MKILKHNDTSLVVYDNGSFTVYSSKVKNLEQKRLTGRPNFEVNLFGGKQIFLDETGFRLIHMTEENKKVVFKYVCSYRKIEVEVTLDFSKGRNVFSQTNKITNLGEETIRLTRFSSAFMEDIGNDGTTKAWYEKDSLKIYICHNKWQGEGQWQAYTPQELGIYPVTTHGWEREAYRIQSVGSWSTANYYPFIIVEDQEAGLSWFMELEGSHSWMMKLAAYGGYENPQLTLEATGCEEANGNWFYDLKPKESYSTERAFLGVTDGGFEEAAAELLAFKREDSLIPSDRKVLPVVFNDYMDCVWDKQSPELLIPLIEAAAAVGCEVFCIDGGWCENKNGSGLGDWLAKKEDFSKISLETVIRKILDCGMTPGIWFEWEACSDTADGFMMEPDCILKRHGAPVGESRCFYNLKSRKVREYLKEKVRYFYRLGVRYIKNDYNQSLGAGCTNNYDGESPAQGLIENCNAFYDFIEELYREFPDLVIENCGSGAMRCDHKTVRHFALQSISDQELYKNNPSILMGSLAQYPPEKAAIWSYPYPVMLDELDTFKLTEKYKSRMEDGKQTAFNMITAMMGVLYLSGRIDLCDDKNNVLIREAICLYKKNREYIGKSRPIYPLGMHRINQKELTALGLLSEKKLLLAVWNLSGEEQEAEINLTKWISKEACLAQKYPLEGTDVVLENGVLRCRLNVNEAVFAEVDL